MQCPKCGKEIFNNDISFCIYCGTYLHAPVNNLPKNNKKEHKILKKLLYVSLIIVWLSIVGVVFVLSKKFYYFDEDIVNNQSNNDTYINKISTSGLTQIEHENKYVRSYVGSLNDVYKLINEDSVSQKKNCPEEIISIEEEIINNYNIKAVNLCEMSPTLANELKNVIAYIYNEYPKQRGYITNITLGNVGENSYIAAFMPIFVFVNSDTKSTYPIGIKTQIILNAEYFLNEPRFNNTMSHGVNIGYYPPNATKSTTVAHEFGHYLSFRAMVKYYQMNNINYVTAGESKKVFDIYDDFLVGNFSYSIINSAYENYIRNYNGTLSFDEFRGTISSYAIAKDKNGKYIYDETIAEAFHDCYLNGNNAKLASKLIWQSLERYL